MIELYVWAYACVCVWVYVPLCVCEHVCGCASYKTLSFVLVPGTVCYVICSGQLAHIGYTYRHTSPVCQADGHCVCVCMCVCGCVWVHLQVMEKNELSSSHTHTHIYRV